MSDHNNASEPSNSSLIRFRCPGCNTVLQAPEQYAGKSVHCSKCQLQLQVPNAPASAVGKMICICGTCKTVFQTSDQTQQQKCSKCGGQFELPPKNGQVSTSGMFRFQCQSCAQVYCVLSKYGGKKINCLKCHQPMSIPVPPQPKVDVLKLVEPEVDIPEEVPDEQPSVSEPDDMAEVPSGPAGRPDRSRKPPTVRPQKGEEKSLMAKLKIPLIAIAGVFGIVIGFLIVTSIFSKKGESQAESAGTIVQSPQAIAFAEEVIRQLAAKNIDQVSGYFEEETDELAIRTLSRMLDVGTLDRVESEVTYSNIQSGAEGYRVHSKAIYSDGFERQADMAFCLLEGGYDLEEEASTISYIMSMQLTEKDGSVLYTVGETDTALLTASLDQIVEENATFGEIPTSVLCPILIGILVLALVTLISQISVFVNAGEPGWAVFIPVYREVCMARIADKSEGLGWLCGFSNFIPYVGGVIYLVLICTFSIGIARNYNRGLLFGLGLCFLPFIFYPILAFCGHAYD